MDLGPARVSTGADAPRRRSVRRLLRWCLVAAAGAALVSPGSVAAQDSAPAATFEITVDDDRALFELSRLVPGPVGQRCLAVEVRNGAATSVSVSAQVAGALGPYLSIVIEAGDATDPATCGGFTGSQQFSGTVAELGNQHGDSAAGLVVPLIDDRRAVLRFTLSLADDNAAQGKRVELSLVFDATDVTPPPTTVPDTTTAPTTTVPETTVPPTTVPTSLAPTSLAPTSSLLAPVAPSASVTLAPTTTDREDRPPRTTTAGQAAPATTGSPSSPDTPDIVVIDAGETVAPSLADQAVDAIEAGVEAAVAVADVTARSMVVPGAFSGIALAFFLLQSRFERSDPKLADAPLEPEPDLLFEPRVEVTV